MIGKELLSDVLGINDINLVLDEGNEINYTRYATITRGSRDVFINKYELAHKCKEWAKNNSDFKTIYSGSYNSLDQGFLYICLLETNDFWADTEPEAIFKACQWILENK